LDYGVCGHGAGGDHFVAGELLNVNAADGVSGVGGELLALRLCVAPQPRTALWRASSIVLPEPVKPSFREPSRL